MKLTREQSLSQYGTEAYTAWGIPEAQQDAAAKGINVMQKQPNPAQLQTNATGQPVNQTIQANQTNQAKTGYQPQKGFTDTQNQYAEQMYNAPDYASLYGQYSNETGLTDINKKSADLKKLITDIDDTVFDIEDKIAKIEPNINKEVGNYLINESQRGRMVDAGEKPLRTQYADILRSRARLSGEASNLSADATAKSNLVNTLMGYAQQSYTDKGSYLKTLMDIEKSNKASTSSGSKDYKYAGVTESQPTNTPRTEGVAYHSPQGQWSWDWVSKSWYPTGGSPLSKEKEPTLTEGDKKRTVVSEVQKAKDSGATSEEIKAYIAGQGYSPFDEDFLYFYSE